jgi:ABC-type bacteriocin/lantibiotic exporter with double-glycine peptidase domain/CRP-like cAMP-binding protein
VGVWEKSDIVIDDLLDRSVLGLLFSRSELVRRSKQFETRKLNPGEILFRENSANDGLYLVLEGEIQVSQNLEGVETVSLSTISDLRSIDLLSTVKDVPRRYTSKALSKSVVLHLPRTQLLEALDAKPIISDYLLKMTQSSHHKGLANGLRTHEFSRDFQVAVVANLKAFDLPAEKTFQPKRNWIGYLAFGEANIYVRSEDNIYFQIEANINTEDDDTSILNGESDSSPITTAASDKKFTSEVTRFRPLKVGTWIIIKDDHTRFRAVEDVKFMSIENTDSLAKNFSDEWSFFLELAESNEISTEGTDLEVSQPEELFKDLIDYTKKRPKDFPFVLQLDEMDCGAAALQMITKHFGADVSLNFIKDKLDITSSGASIGDLERVAGQLGFRAYTLEVADLKSLELSLMPFIVLKDHHYLVVFDKIDDRYLVADPAIGIVSLSENDLRSKEGTFVLTLKPEKLFYKRCFPKEDFSFLRPLLLEARIPIAKIGVAALLTSLTGIFVAYLIQKVSDSVLSQQAEALSTSQNLSPGLATLIGLIFSVVTFSALLNLVKTKLTLNFSQTLGQKIEAGFFKKVLNLTYKAYSQKRIGDFTQRISDIYFIQEFFAKEIVRISINFLLCFVFLLGLGIYSQLLLFFSVTIIPVMALLSWLMEKRSRPLYAMMLKKVTEKESSVIEFIRGLLALKTSGSTKLAFETVQSKGREIQGHRKRFGEVVARNSVWVDYSVHLFRVAFILIAAVQYQKGNLTIGEVFATLLIFDLFLNPLLDLTQQWPNLIEVKTMLRRLGDVFVLPEETSDSTHAKIKVKSVKSIEFKNVSFKYRESDTDWIIENLNFKFQYPDKVLITGKSGEGKSSIFLLILGLVKPQNGKILINGMELDEVDLPSLRQSLPLATQSPQVFPLSVGENVAMDSEYDQKRVTEALKKSGFDLVMKKRGLALSSSMIGDGSGLSRGELQRMVLARMFYQSEDSALMDEATSSLDPQNENRVIENILKQKEGLILAISHNEKLVEKFPKSFRLENSQMIPCHQKPSKKKSA